MKRLYCTLESATPLFIIPDMLAPHDEHPVLSTTYHVFLNSGEDDQELMQTSNVYNDFSHPHYYGRIIFERADQIFTYQEGDRRLDRSEIEEVIACITDRIAKPHLWQTGGPQ